MTRGRHDINEAVKLLSNQALEALEFQTMPSPTHELLNSIRAATFMERIDQFEAFLVANFEPIKLDEPEHIFSKGMYARKLILPAGSCVTGKIHKKEHQFAILKGLCTVYNGNEKGVLMQAGDSGITQPGTRRRVLVHEETIWMTYHPTDKTTVEDVEDELIEKHVNRYLITAQNQKMLCHS
jgi:hypothetical protein